MPSESATSVTLTRAGDVLAGTDGGVLRSRDRGETWKQVGLTHSVHALATLSTGTILAGTDRGIFGSTDGGERWVERSIGLTDFRIVDFAAAPDRTVYACSMSGRISRSDDEGERWRVIEAPLPGAGPSCAMLVDSGGRLLAGSRGLWHWVAADERWQLIPLTAPQPQVAIRALVMDARGSLFAASEGGGIFTSFDSGVTWTAANEGLEDNRVYSLAADAEGHVLAGTLAGVFRLRR